MITIRTLRHRNRPKEGDAPASFVRGRCLVPVVLCLVTSCAVPRPPTGGPPDTIPPGLVESLPEAGAVNVEENTIRLTFSEYVDQGSFPQALAISPAPAGRLEYDWNGRSVEVRLPERLRPNTTYVLTLDTNLRDVRGVALKQPITIAFSTGPAINRGRLGGRVLEATRGEGLGGFDVFAYAVPDSNPPAALPERPDYRTQTGEDGSFLFEYLNEQPYFVVALRDLNRNRQPDAGEPFAVPPAPLIVADTTRDQGDPVWLVTALDTMPPELQRVRPISNRRLALRFSEPVHLTTRDPEAWLVRDSVEQRPVVVHDVYTLPDDRQQVFVYTDTLSPAPHVIRPAAVADTSGNAVRPNLRSFLPSPDPDTLGLRFLGFQPSPGASDEPSDNVLSPRLNPTLRFNQPVPPNRLQNLVTVQDTTGQPRSFEAVSRDGTTFHLQVQPPVAPGETVVVQVDGAALGVDTLYTGTFTRLSERLLGTLSGVAQVADSVGTVVVELFETGTPVPVASTRLQAPGGPFSFTDIPEGSYRFRAFLDRDGDETWDGGRITPYREAEPVTWSSEPLAWRARWDTVLEDTLRIAPR